MRRLARRIDVMPILPVVFGLGEIEAAAAIGISASKFRALVNDKRMPSPRRLDGRNIWDVDELRTAFKALPHAEEDEKADFMDGRGVIRLKYVHAFRDRLGRMRYYFRQHGKRTALPGLPGSSEFMAAYATQLMEYQSKSRHGQRRPREHLLRLQSATLAHRSISHCQPRAAQTIAGLSIIFWSNTDIVKSTK